MERLLHILIALLLAVLRVAGHKSQAFQALAHCYVGGLFGAWLADHKLKGALWLAVILSLLELACFLHDRGFI